MNNNYQQYDSYEFPDLPREARDYYYDVSNIFAGTDLERNSEQAKRTAEIEQLELEISEADTIPLLYGTRRVKGFLLWYGNRKYIQQGDDVVWKVTVAFGICMGEATLLKIWVGDDMVHRHIPSSLNPYTGKAAGEKYPDMWGDDLNDPAEPDALHGNVDLMPPELSQGGSGGGDDQDSNYIYEPFQSLRFYRGLSTQTADPMITLCTDGTRIPVWKNLCYCVFEDFYLKSKDEIPEVTFEIYREGYDMSPSYIVADLLTNSIYGLGYDKSEILNTNSFDAVTDYTTVKNDLGISPLLTKETSALDYIKYIASHHFGFLTIEDNLIKYHQIMNKSAITAITRDDLITGKNLFKTKKVNKGFNKIQIKFPKRMGYYATKIASYSYDLNDSETEKECKIELEFTRGARSMTMARAFVEAQRNDDLEVQFTLPFSSVNDINVGDVITLTDTDYGMDGINVRVKKITLNAKLTINIMATLEKRVNIKYIEHPDQVYESYHMSGYPGKVRCVQLQKDTIDLKDVVKLHYAGGNRSNWWGSAIFRSYDGDRYEQIYRGTKRPLRAKITALSVSAGVYTARIELVEENLSLIEEDLTIPSLLHADSNFNKCWCNFDILDGYAGFENIGLSWRFVKLVKISQSVFDMAITSTHWDLSSHDYIGDGDFDANDFINEYITMLDRGNLPYIDAIPSSYTGDIYYKICSINQNWQMQRLQDVVAYTITIS